MTRGLTNAILHEVEQTNLNPAEHAGTNGVEEQEEMHFPHQLTAKVRKARWSKKIGELPPSMACSSPRMVTAVGVLSALACRQLRISRQCFDIVNATV